MSDPHPAVKKYVATLVSPNQRIEALEARVAELEAALDSGVLGLARIGVCSLDVSHRQDADEQITRLERALAAEKGDK